jgi:spondin-1
LVSLVSTLYPSPDWFVGISGLELCLSNGSWVDQRTLHLYPYDAGTDNGPVYVSPKQPTVPQESIKRIRSNQPNDPRSPFFDRNNIDMKPLARLHIVRTKLFEKTCEDPVTDTDTDDDETTKNYDFYSPNEPDSCQGGNCNEDQGSYDEEPEPENEDVAREKECRLGDWILNECSVPCGPGFRTRTRSYIVARSHQKCWAKHRDVLEETVQCQGNKCPGSANNDNSDEKVKYGNDLFNVTL